MWQGFGAWCEPAAFPQICRRRFWHKGSQVSHQGLGRFSWKGSTSLGVLCKKGYGIWLFKWRQNCSKHSPALTSCVPSVVLFRAMVPLIPETLPDLTRKHIFISSGIFDPIVSKKEAERLFNSFKTGGANISFNWQESGHEWTMQEIRKSKVLLHKWTLFLQMSTWKSSRQKNENQQRGKVIWYVPGERA